MFAGRARKRARKFPMRFFVTEAAIAEWFRRCARTFVSTTTFRVSRYLLNTSWRSLQVRTGSISAFRMRLKMFVTAGSFPFSRIERRIIFDL